MDRNQPITTYRCDLLNLLKKPFVILSLLWKIKIHIQIEEISKLYTSEFLLLTFSGSNTVSTPLGIVTEPEVALNVLAGLGPTPAVWDVISHVTCALPDWPIRRCNLKQWID